MSISRSIFKWGAALAVAALLVGCSSTTEPASDAQSNGSTGTAPAVLGDITELCGDKPMKVGFLKSNGGNPTVVQANAEFELEAAKCENITETFFAETVNDQQKAIADINSFIAQGVNVIVITPDFGAAQLPALKQATDAGVSVVTVLGGTGGVAGEDFVANLDWEYQQMAEQWVEFVHGQLPDGGTVAFLGGPAVNNWTAAMWPPTQEALKKYPNLELVGDDWQVTDWDPAVKKQVMTGLLARHGRIDAVISDYAGTETGTLQAYDDASYERPVLATVSPSNEMGCDWIESPYPYFVFGGTNSYAAPALRVGVGAFQGTSDERGELTVAREASTFMPDGAEQPACEASLPPGIDLSADLTTEQFRELFG